MNNIPGFPTTEELELKKKYIIAESLIIMQWPHMAKHSEELHEIATIIANGWDEMRMDELIKELMGKEE